MGKPFKHAQSSAKTFGGKPLDYIKIHEKMDCSKGEIGDIRHRLLTHHMFFVRECIVPIFGSTIVNSDGKEVSVVEVCEYHIYEDFSDEGKHNGFIPTAGDYLAHLDFVQWMNNGEGGASPASPEKRVRYQKEKEIAAAGWVSPSDIPAQGKDINLVIDGGGFGPPKPNPYESIEDKSPPIDLEAIRERIEAKRVVPRQKFFDGPMKFD